MLFNKPLKLFSIIAIFATILVVLFSAILVFLQLSILNQVLFSPALFKVLTGVMMLVVIFVVFAVPKGIDHRSDFRLSKRSLAICLSYLLLLVFSFGMVFLRSATEVGFANAIGAFQYNHSLNIFMLPFSLIVLRSFSPITQRMHRRLRLLFRFILGFVLLSAVLQCLQMALNGPVLLWNDQAMMTIVYEQAYIKFDQISGLYRAQGLFRSPLEAGLLGVGVALICMVRLLETHKRSIWWLLLVTVSLGCFATGSRTVYLLFMGSVASFAILAYISHQNARSFLNSRMPIFILFGGMVLVFAVSFVSSKVGEGLLNPTNFLIRLDIWNALLSRWSSSVDALLFGLGVVQNGKYGDYHSVAIDNTLIGLLLNIGIFGAMLATFVFVQWAREVSARLKQVSSLASVAMVSYVIGTVLASNFENLMHLSYSPVVFYFLLRLYAQIYSLPKIGFPTPLARGGRYSTSALVPE